MKDKRYIELDRVMQNQMVASDSGQYEKQTLKQYVSPNDIEIISEFKDPGMPEANSVVTTKSGISFPCTQTAKEIISLKYGD